MIDEKIKEKSPLYLLFSMATHKFRRPLDIIVYIGSQRNNFIDELESKIPKQHEHSYQY